MQRLLQLENMSTCTKEQFQVAEHLLRKRQTLIEMLEGDKGALQKEIIRLQIQSTIIICIKR